MTKKALSMSRPFIYIKEILTIKKNKRTMIKLKDYKSEIKKDHFKSLNNSIIYISLIVIFLNPFPHITAIKEILFYTALIFVVVLFFLKQKKFCFKSPFLPAIGMFAIWSIVSVIFAIDKPASIHDIYSHFIKYLIFYYVIVNFFNTKRYFIYIIITIIASEFIFSTGLLIHYYGILDNSIASRLAHSYSAVAVDIIPFGIIFGILLAIWYFRVNHNISNKLFLAAIIIILLATTILTQSRGAILALFVSLIVILWGYRKKIFIALLITTILIMTSPMKNRFLPTTFFNDNQRLGLIYYSLEIIKDNPIIGIGFAIDTFRDERVIDKKKYASRIPEQYRSNPFLWPHNMLLNIGVRTGVLGLILFANIFIAIFITCFKLILHGKDDFIRSSAQCCLAMTVMFFVNGLFHPIFVHFLDTIFYTICAMVTIIWKINKKPDNLECI